jgi:hypothetical protein
VLAHHPQLLEVSLELLDLAEEVRLFLISTLTKISDNYSQLHRLDLEVSHLQVSQLDKAHRPQALAEHPREDRRPTVTGTEWDFMKSDRWRKFEHRNGVEGSWVLHTKMINCSIDSETTQFNEL